MKVEPDNRVGYNGGLRMSKKVLVTGGTGFIGSHLVERLLEEDHEVVVLDNCSTGQLSNIQSFQSKRNFHFYERDIAHFDSIREFFSGVEVVYHIAGLADIVPSIQRPLDYFHSNVEGTTSVMESARLAGVRRIVYAASSSCYGIPDQYPTPETAPIRPQYPYALTKYLGEQIVLHWGKVYKISVNSLRFFNVYGPRARTSGTYGAVFGVFLAQKINGKPLTIVGDGTQTRDFTYVSDVVEAVVRVANTNLSNEILNVGSGTTVSINRIAELLGGEKVFIPKRPGEPECTFADISKIKKLTQWRPKVSIEEGMNRLLEQIHDWQSAPVWTPELIASATSDWFRYLGKG